MWWCICVCVSVAGVPKCVRRGGSEGTFSLWTCTSACAFVCVCACMCLSERERSCGPGAVLRWSLFVIAQWTVPASIEASCVCFEEWFHMHGPKRHLAALGRLPWPLTEHHQESCTCLFCWRCGVSHMHYFLGLVFTGPAQGVWAERVYGVRQVWPLPCASVGKVCSIMLRILNTSRDSGNVPCRMEKVF